MTEQTSKIYLQKLVRKKFAKPLDSIKSFEELSEATHLSLQTLRRFFGKIDKNKGISVASLSVLSRYVGYSDWEDFIQNGISEKDKFYIENMSAFFKNGKKYNLDYHQNTLIVDTLNEYVSVIYSRKENVEYFYELYQDNNWVCDYVFAWLPNYNFFGQDWFRRILNERIEKTSAETVKLALCNFLFLGAFLSDEKIKVKQPKIETLKDFYREYRQKHRYMPYHEMRYHSILLIEAKKNKDEKEFYRIHYLDNLKNSGLTVIHQQELVIFLCNTLVWLQEYSICYDLLKSAKNFLKIFSKSANLGNPIHYFGINIAFVKTTFAMVWIANKNYNIEEFELTDIDFQDPTGLLYNDYIQLMYIGNSIITAKGIVKKMRIFNELQTLVKKTNYHRIHIILEDFEVDFHTYFS